MWKAVSFPRALRYLVYIGSIASCFLLVGIGYMYWSKQRAMFVQIEQEARHILDSSVAQMDEKFHVLQRLGDTLADELTTGHLRTKSEIRQRLEEIAQKYPAVFGIGVAFEPYAFSDEQRLYAPYVTESNGKELAYKPLHEQYDYSEANWYQKTLDVDSRWMEPLYGKAAGTRIVDYVVPFYMSPDKKDQEHIRGVVYVDYSLQRVNDLLDELQIGETGYGFIVSASGKLVAHPDGTFLQKEYTITDLAQEYGSSALSRMARDLQEGNKDYGSYDYIDPISGKPSLLFFQKMSLTQWVLCVNFVKQEVVPGQLHILYQYMIWLIVAGVLCGVMGASHFIAIWNGRVNDLIHWSIIASVVILCGIIALWYLQLYVRQPRPEQGTVISSKTGLQRFLRDTNSELDTIPTGIQLSNFSFQDMNKVQLVGSFWQRYASDIPETSRDFFFLQGVFDERVMLQQYTNDNTELRYWHFNAILHQNFQYHEFPFDYKHVHIPIVLENNHNQYILIPDLSGYIVTTPSSLPGISDTLSLESWQPVMSYFSYAPVSFVRKQIAPDVGISLPHQLHYNFIVRRVFLSHLISYALPLLVGLLAIFFTLVSMFPPAQVSSPPHIKETLGPLGMFISVMFVLVTIHVSLRGFMSGQPIFYLEYFYLLGYAIILVALWVSQNVVFGSKRTFIAYQNGIIPKILYWPSWLLGIFIVTVVTFYT